MNEKVDFKKSLDSYQAKRDQFRLLEIPQRQYLAIDGQGDPNTSVEFTEAIETLYPLAYKLKFASKKERGRDYVVPPLEALWWADNMESFTEQRDKSQWFWTLMLMVPDWLTGLDVDQAVSAVQAKNVPKRLAEVRLMTLAEGQCVQTLYVGPFDDEGPVLERMHREFIEDKGLNLTGKHHEVYLSDFRKTPPEKLRTILRQPVTSSR